MEFFKKIVALPFHDLSKVTGEYENASHLKVCVTTEVAHKLNAGTQVSGEHIAQNMYKLKKRGK